MEIQRTEEQFNALRQAERLLMVQFGSETCTPCTAIRRKLEEWLTGHPRVFGGYVPVEEARALSAQLGVFTVPTILVYAEGRLSARASGYFSLEDLLRQVERYEALLFPEAQ